MKRILVIDDDDTLRTTIRTALRKQGYETLEAASGEAGVVTAQTLLPDLVLSDVRMGNLDGFGVLNALRSGSATSGIPVILMTGRPEEADARYSMDQGADDYLEKPFDMETLTAAVRTRLQRRQEVQTSTHANEGRLLEILAASQDLVAMVETETSKLLYLNVAGRNMLGIGIEENLEAIRLADFVAEAGTGVTNRKSYEQARDNRAWVGESTFRSRGGRLIPVSQQVLVHDARNNQEPYLSIVARDISERRQAAEAIHRSERLLRTILDVLPQRVFWKDREGRFLGANNQFLADCGMTEVVGKTDFDMPWSRDQADRFRVDDRQVIESGQAKLGIVEQITDAGGRTMWLSTSKVPMRNSEGEITGVLGTYLDITSLRRSEQDRQMMEIQLRQAQKLEAVGQLAAGIAHEINTPTQYVGDNTRFLKEAFDDIARALAVYGTLLEAVKANTLTPELLQRTEETLAATDLEYLFAQVPSAIRETLEGVERVSKIVRAMKEFSHPGSKDKAPADLNKAIETTVTVCRNEWKYVADMVLELDPTLPAVPCFLSEFNQAVLNLVVNAAHAIGDVVKRAPGTKGRITIRTSRGPDYVEVRVADSGTGIPEANRSRIFDPFFTTKEVGKGTGQGLAIVYANIVKRHEGRVAFETETGNGTTFILHLPIPKGKSATS